MKRFLASAAVVAVIFISIIFCYKGYQLWQLHTQPIEIHGTLVKKPKNIPSFILNQGHGKTFDDSQLANHWSVMFFGYTRCPDICPSTLKTLSSMYKQLSDLPSKQKPKIIFVSIDSEYDHDQHNEHSNKATMYSQYFNNNFIGLTGSKAQIKELTNALGVVALKVKTTSMTDENSDNYIFDHSSTLYVINPKGQLQAILTGPHKPDNLAKDIKSILTKFG